MKMPTNKAYIDMLEKTRSVWQEYKNDPMPMKYKPIEEVMVYRLLMVERAGLPSQRNNCPLCDALYSVEEMRSFCEYCPIEWSSEPFDSRAGESVELGKMPGNLLPGVATTKCYNSKNSPYKKWRNSENQDDAIDAINDMLNRIENTIAYYRSITPA